MTTNYQNRPRFQRRAAPKLRENVLLKNANAVQATEFVPLSATNSRVSARQVLPVLPVLQPHILHQMPQPPILYQIPQTPPTPTRNLTPEEISTICQKAQQTLNLALSGQCPCSGLSIIPVAKPDRRQHLIPKTGYQFFCEYFAKKSNGRLPPGGTWNRLPANVIRHFNLLADQYNSYWQLSQTQ